ncbi:zinc finger, CCHC-type containing protein [Tanacetum coccineum]
MPKVVVFNLWLLFYLQYLQAISASSLEVPSVLEFLQRRKLETKKEVAASEFSHLNHSLSHRPVSVKPDISKPDISKASSAGGKLHILKPSCERNGITPTPKESLSPTSGSKVPNSPLTGKNEESYKFPIAVQQPPHHDFSLMDILPGKSTRLRSEDPNQHLKDFLKLVDSLHLDVTNRDRTRLRLFQFSLRDQASNWLERLPVGSISPWEDLTTRFLVQLFPSGRTAKLCNDILIFQQHQGESLSEAWTRFKDLLQKFHHHGIDLWL